MQNIQYKSNLSGAARTLPENTATPLVIVQNSLSHELPLRGGSYSVHHASNFSRFFTAVESVRAASQRRLAQRTYLYTSAPSHMVIDSELSVITSDLPEAARALRICWKDARVSSSGAHEAVEQVIQWPVRIINRPVSTRRGAVQNTAV